MEVITLDNEVFKELANKIERIAAYVFSKERTLSQEPDIWLTSEELAHLLKISTRTLQRMRKDKTITYSMIRNKCLYRLSDVEKCIHERVVTCNPQTLDEFRHNYLLTHKELHL